MTAKVDGWMPVHIGAYTAATGHLTTTEHGMYFLLMLHAWNNGGALPEDLERWRKIARAERKEWAESVPTIMAFWTQQPDGTFRQKRLDAELAKAGELKASKSEAGKKGAESRWQKDGKRMAQPLAGDMANGMAKACPIPLPEPNPLPVAIASTVANPQGGPSHTEAMPLSEAKLNPETPAAILASVCVANSIKATAFHPLVVEWARDGFTVDALKAAIAKARMHKGDAKIPVAYLDPILRDASKPRDFSWKKDEAKAAALCSELGIPGPKRGEELFAFHQRVESALADRSRRHVA